MDVGGMVDVYGGEVCGGGGGTTVVSIAVIELP